MLTCLQSLLGKIFMDFVGTRKVKRMGLLCYGFEEKLVNLIKGT